MKNTRLRAEKDYYISYTQEQLYITSLRICVHNPDMLFKLVHFSRSYMMRKQATSHNLCTYKHITQVGTSHGVYAYLVGDGEDLPWRAEGETQ